VRLTLVLMVLTEGESSYRTTQLHQNVKLGRVRQSDSRPASHGDALRSIKRYYGVRCPNPGLGSKHATKNDRPAIGPLSPLPPMASHTARLSPALGSTANGRPRLVLVFPCPCGGWARGGKGGECEGLGHIARMRQDDVWRARARGRQAKGDWRHADWPRPLMSVHFHSNLPFQHACQSCTG
jgi:hypothetical protein